MYFLQVNDIRLLWKHDLTYEWLGYYQRNNIISFFSNQKLRIVAIYHYDYMFQNYTECVLKTIFRNIHHQQMINQEKVLISLFAFMINLLFTFINTIHSSDNSEVLDLPSEKSDFLFLFRCILIWFEDKTVLFLKICYFWKNFAGVLHWLLLWSGINYFMLVIF